MGVLEEPERADHYSLGYEDLPKISRRKAARLAHDADAYGKDLFEHLYPGYIFNDVEIKSSSYVDGVYIYARMRRRR